MHIELSTPEKRLLRALPDGASVPVAEAARLAGFGSDVEVLGAVSRPAQQGLIAVLEQSETLHHLSPEGLSYARKGLPERRAAEAIVAAGGRVPLSDVAARAGLSAPEATVATGWLRKKEWGRIEKSSNGSLLVVPAKPPLGADEAALATLGASPSAGHDSQGLKLLAQRGGLLVETVRTARSLRLTPAGAKARAALGDASQDADEVTQVTPELLSRWPTLDANAKAATRLRPFDVAAQVEPAYPAKPHPLQQIMAEIRRIFFAMGFTEIEGDYVESSYWNMDALFIPQDHPARDMQDTFYLKEPAALDVGKADLDRAAKVHATGGGTGSSGWGGSYSPDIAKRALLRTHTTSTTIRYLAKNPKGAHKVFGLGRVFRNEAMDATHLPEFTQIEGIVTEPGANFGTLIGVLKEFYARMGFPEVKVRPSYYPYTEPSLDVAVKWGNKWLELGGAGMFRPEVTQPLGVEHPVLAWGLGLERLAMMRLGLKDIRQLYLSDVQWLRSNPLQ